MIFTLSRDSNLRGTGEPHVIVVCDSGDLRAGYCTETADVVEVVYSGGGWRAFEREASEAFNIAGESLQVVIDEIYARAEERPVVMFVRNAGALCDDCGRYLVQYACYWEKVALDNKERGNHMYLALEIAGADHAE